MIIYKGKRTNEGIIVLRNERPLSLKASLKLYPHSPDGFNWGYGGSGPAQLALALLYNATHDKNLSVNNYQAFKWDHVSRWGDNWQITAQEILDWLRVNIRIRQGQTTGGVASLKKVEELREGK